jgi:hypothetical protein
MTLMPDEPLPLDYYRHRRPKRWSWQQRFSFAMLIINLVIVSFAAFFAARWMFAD